ncbi:ABC transporter permease subunit [Paenibacillus sp. LMG 31459]|uniref:ABC transporter permease subunit n=1 Tax=Paenibacillus phytohabitans TaxID=2654978 RepID=A0ABX1YDY3_9BACL|nr:ABC transporter permease subunit [Paenibacillus phytohabitans]NOU79016.1 ABC transporter permease subunit [Paenibacillus phytohabitans]
MNSIDKNRQRVFHLMLLLPVVILFIFSYLPIFGIVIAFQDYQPGLGFFKSDWVGFENFRTLALLPDFMPALRNTLVIAVFKIIGNLVFPVAFALMLNELRVKWFKKTVQTITYLPYFLSWVVLGGILLDFLSQGNTSSDAGLMNTALLNLGLIDAPISFLGDKHVFPGTVIISDVWKHFGYNTIVYLAALTNINPSLYEASSIDGAGRWKQTWSVTLPGITPIIILMTVLSIGSILNAGFEQIFVLYSPSVYETGDIIDTLVYRLGLVDSQFSLSAAVGVFKSVVSGILILVSFKLADKYAGYRVF